MRNASDVVSFTVGERCSTPSSRAAHVPSVSTLAWRREATAAAAVADRARRNLCANLPETATSQRMQWESGVHGKVSRVPFACGGREGGVPHLGFEHQLLLLEVQVFGGQDPCLVQQLRGPEVPPERCPSMVSGMAQITVKKGRSKRSDLAGGKIILGGEQGEAKKIVDANVLFRRLDLPKTIGRLVHR